MIVADIQNSTAAVESGRHNDVNIVAAGSLIVALNIARQMNVEIPFFFGGDGGSLLAPQHLVDPILAGLYIHNFNCQKNFGLTLHIGSISVTDVQADGRNLKIAKMLAGTGLSKAVLVGDGLIYAEHKIKSLSTYRQSEPATRELNLTGLECRWDHVKPPHDENEIVCFLIEAIDPLKQLDVYREVLTKLDETYGTLESRSPLSLERLKLLFDFEKIKKEILIKYGRWRVGHFLTTLFQTLLGPLFFKYNLKFDNIGGRDYLLQLISNADTLIVDGRISTIVSGNSEKRIQFITSLNSLEKQGVLIFGHHVSKESVMTCYIENRNAKHIHFIDGSDGGYTAVAKKFKSKLASFRLNK